MTVQELIESERQSGKLLEAIGNLHPTHAKTQRIVAQAALESLQRLGMLQELAHYKGAEGDSNGYENAGEHIDRNGGNE